MFFHELWRVMWCLPLLKCMLHGGCPPRPRRCWDKVRSTGLAALWLPGVGWALQKWRAGCWNPNKHFGRVDGVEGWLPSLKLTKTPLKISRYPIGKDRIPTIHFQGLWLLVSGRVKIWIPGIFGSDAKVMGFLDFLGWIFVSEKHCFEWFLLVNQPPFIFFCGGVYRWWCVSFLLGSFFWSQPEVPPICFL